jgi:hypothetical protein
MDWKCRQYRTQLQATQLVCSWVIAPEDLAFEFTDPTLMATRAFLQMYLAGPSVPAGVGGIAAIGLIAWDGLVSPPIGDLCPGPIRNCDYDWVARWSAPVPAGAPVGVLSPNIFDNTHLSRARRRLPTGTGLLVAFETIEIPVNFALDIRCLIKE